MAKSEYRIVPHNGHWVAAKLANTKRHVIVNCKGAAPFVISRAEWDNAEVVAGGAP